MVDNLSSPLLALSVLILGFRHGIDWDHIAAISDIVSSTKDNKSAVLYGFVYILAHAVVIIFLGLLAIILGVNLPSWADALMGPVVAFTLILLGLWIILSILVKRERFRFVSKWMILFKWLIHIYNHLFGDRHHHPIEYPQNFGVRSSYLLGTVHGIGAETPTQILLFTTAAGLGGIYGISLLFVFIAGLLASNTLVLILSLLGFIHAKKLRIYSVLGILAGLISIVVGVTILLEG